VRGPLLILAALNQTNAGSYAENELLAMTSWSREILTPDIPLQLQKPLLTNCEDIKPHHIVIRRGRFDAQVPRIIEDFEAFLDSAQSGSINRNFGRFATIKTTREPKHTLQ